MQPHAPFLNSLHLENKNKADLKKPINFWYLKKQGLSRVEIITSYKENLEIVLEHALELSKKLSDKTVITSDYRNL